MTIKFITQFCSYHIEMKCTSSTHYGLVTRICVGNLTIIGSDNSLSPGRRQTIIWTNAGMLLIGHVETNFDEILIEILTFSFKKMCLKLSSAKWLQFCLGLNELKQLTLKQVFHGSIGACKLVGTRQAKGLALPVRASASKRLFSTALD